ncbi:MAG: hypothetical protein OEZ06_15600 [Myxococcales bacterium]|nr:hypothetical protein [Myxococcales bacterium]
MSTRATQPARATAWGLLPCLLGLFVAAGGARADGPLGPNGAPIETSSYSIDLGAGPILAGSRPTGLGGAYVAIAEEVDGNQQNPAAPAVRPAYSLTHFDFSLGLGVTFSSTVTDNDFFNTGADRTVITNHPDDAVFAAPALNLQWGTFGIGLSVEAQTYALDPTGAGREPSDDDRLEATIGRLRLQTAKGFYDGQLIAGVGAGPVAMSITRQRTRQEAFVDETFANEAILDSGGLSFELGALWRPIGLPIRAGAAVQTGVRTEISAGDHTQNNGDVVIDPEGANPIFLPRSVALPWRLGLGFAFQAGPRPLNPRWIDPSNAMAPARRSIDIRWQRERLDLQRRIEQADAAGDGSRAEAFRAELTRAKAHHGAEIEALEERTARKLKERYHSMPREYLLVSGSLELTSGVENAVGVESFLQGVVNRSGRRPVLSPRVGVETEVLPGYIKLRAGSYLEGSRFQRGSARLHGTLGFDIRVLDWSVFGLWDDDRSWRLGGVIDTAPRYFAWGVSAGGWY